MTTDTIEVFLAAVEEATMAGAEVFCENAVLDATVPGWRFTVRGGSAVRAKLAAWFATPGRFEDRRITATADGAVVEFLLTWVERGVPHAAHQVHLLRLRGGRIAEDVAFCGGKWPASRLAEMEAAQLAADRDGAGIAS